MKCINILMGSLLLFGFVACEKDVSVYDSTVCRLNFDYGEDVSTNKVTDEMRIVSHSFMLNSEEDAKLDTVWVKVVTMGYLSDNDRPFLLQQVMTGERDAVAGEHYVAFDDAGLAADFYYIPKGKSEALIPIVVKRASSLVESGDVVLKFAFKDNTWFEAGYPEFGFYLLTISDRLSKPSMWTTCQLNRYFGEYGVVKHELMIEWMDEDWGDVYITSLFYEGVSGGSVKWYPKDRIYISYLTTWFGEKLRTSNAERLADPAIGDVWRESDGRAVYFTPIED